MNNTEKKAKELIDKFRRFVDSEEATDTGFCYSYKNETENAKKCALVAVDEILANIDATMLYLPSASATLNINKEFWTEVKHYLS